MGAFSATIRIRNNNQAPSGPVALPWSYLWQLMNGKPCQRSIAAYYLLGSGWQTNRVAQWNKKNGQGFYYTC